MELDELVKGLLGELGKISQSDAVAGSVRDAGKAKVLPLSKISIGFASGAAGGSSKARGDAKADASLDGGGVAGAVSVEPRAFVVVGEDGVPHMLALKKGKTAVLRRGMQITPGGERPVLSAPSEPAKLPGGKPSKQ